MSVTPNMNLTLPTPEVTTGPEWANEIVEAFDDVDAHDHTSGKGVQVPTAGININADLEFNNQNAIELRSSRYTSHGSTLSEALDKNCVYFVNGDLFINNNTGTSVQLTSGNSINLSTVGTIGGDYGQPGVTASATYSDSTKTFSWTQAPTQAAKMAVGDLLVYETVASANPITIKSTASVGSSYTFWLPQSAPTANQLWRENGSANGANFVTIQGTTNQLTITHGASTITASLPSTLVTPGTLRSTGNFDVNTNKFTVDATSGNTVVAGTLASTGDLLVNTNKFVVTASSGNTAILGDLAVNTNKFNVDAASGNTTVAGTLSVDSGTLTTNQTTFNVVNTTATTVNVAGAATNLTIGATTGTATIRNATTSILGTLNVTGNGQGVVPLGAIIAMSTGLTGAMAVPATGVVSNGYMRCDGAAIPGGNTVSGTTPNLSTSIYLRGSTTYGATGGNNTTTLATTNLPSHTHTMTHGHANTFALGGTTTFGSSAHTHNFAHVHEWSFGALGGGVEAFYYTNNTIDDASTSITSSDYIWLRENTAVQSGTGTNVTSTLTTGHLYTTGVISPPSGSGSTAVTAGPSATGTVSFSGAVTNFTGDTQATGSGTAFSNEPSYINVIYLMRVS